MKLVLKLCGRPATLRHTLNACSSALLHGRYTWRHNSVLSAVKHDIEAFWTLPATPEEAVKATIAASKSRFIKFVRPGYDSSSKTVVSRRPLSSESILLQADDWQFLFDLGPEQLLFPPEVATTTLRTDGVSHSPGAYFAGFAGCSQTPFRQKKKKKKKRSLRFDRGQPSGRYEALRRKHFTFPNTCNVSRRSTCPVRSSQSLPLRRGTGAWYDRSTHRAHTNGFVKCRGRQVSLQQTYSLRS